MSANMITSYFERTSMAIICLYYVDYLIGSKLIKTF